MIQIEGFNIRIVEDGQFYGRDNALIHEGDPLVEFYDARQDPNRFGRRGQFVSRYYIFTILGGNYPQGLSLDDGVPEWSISPKGMRDVKRYLKGYLQEQS
jgi:hypothetical protein